MKHQHFFLGLLFMLLATTTSAQAIIGGAGVCNVDDDPDNITEMQTQDERYECVVAWDEDNQVLYVYDGTQAVGSRWSDYSSLLPTVSNTDTRLNNPRVVANDLIFDIIDVVGGNAVIGTVSVPVIDIAPVQDVQGGTGASVTNVGGVYTINNTSPEATTVTDGNTVDLTKTGDDITAEVILDPDPSNTATSSAAGLLVPDPLAALPEYDNHADAGVGGVAIGEFFTATATNTMGAIPGTMIKRLF